MPNQKHDILTTVQNILEVTLGEGETELTEEENILFLRLFPALLANGNGHVYMEICIIDYSDELSVAQVYSTMIPKPGPHSDDLNGYLADWNLHSAAGAYGLYGDQKQLYHKLNIALVNSESVESRANALFAGICLAMDEMARRLPEAFQIAFGDSTQ